MNDSCIVTFTSRSIAEMLIDGGSKRWVLDPKRARASRYLVCAFNGAGPFIEKDDIRLHREAFLVAPVSGIESAGGNRYIIRFRQFARISVANVWTGHQNPVWYTSLENIGINSDDLTFTTAPALPT